jgi:hypothetical protein
MRTQDIIPSIPVFMSQYVCLEQVQEGILSEEEMLLFSPHNKADFFRFGVEESLRRSQALESPAPRSRILALLDPDHSVFIDKLIKDKSDELINSKQVVVKTDSSAFEAYQELADKIQKEEGKKSVRV